MPRTQGSAEGDDAGVGADDGVVDAEFEDVSGTNDDEKKSA